jgi:hypothetical protein
VILHFPASRAGQGKLAVVAQKNLGWRVLFKAPRYSAATTELFFIDCRLNRWGS